jgi:hypothetical protein
MPPKKPTDTPPTATARAAIATTELDAAHKGLEEAKAKLAQAELNAHNARQAQHADSVQQARAAASKLQPVADQVAATRKSLAATRAQYGGPPRSGMDSSRGPLGEYARSLASHPTLKTREQIRALYVQAGPLGNKVADSILACDKALKSFAHAQAFGGSIENAERNLQAAAAIDAAGLESECKALVDAVAALQPPQQSSDRLIRIRLLDQAGQRFPAEFMRNITPGQAEPPKLVD